MFCYHRAAGTVGGRRARRAAGVTLRGTAARSASTRTGRATTTCVARARWPASPRPATSGRRSTPPATSHPSQTATGTQSRLPPVPNRWTRAWKVPLHPQVLRQRSKFSQCLGPLLPKRRQILMLRVKVEVINGKTFCPIMDGNILCRCG